MLSTISIACVHEEGTEEGKSDILTQGLEGGLPQTESRFVFSFNNIFQYCITELYEHCVKISVNDAIYWLFKYEAGFPR